MNRYKNKRHQGPTHRGFSIRERGMEGNIPVIVAERHSYTVDWFRENGVPEPSKGTVSYIANTHIRGFLCHPTKGWRSTGPEGRR